MTTLSADVFEKPIEVARVRSRTLALTIAFFAITVGLIVGVRVFGHSDLYDKDQIKTIGYTVDIVRNARWLLPRDTLGQKTTKPPLYNWIGALAIVGTRSYSEFVFKLPSLIAGGVLIWMIISAGRRMAGRMKFAQELKDPQDPISLQTGIIAAMFWVASAPTMRLIYIARPDLLLATFCMGAWMFGTQALEFKELKWKLWTGFWLCVAGAALTKGPVALLPIIYVILASKLVYGSFSRFNRPELWLGILLMLAVVGIWGIPALLKNRQHVVDVMIKQQLVNRVVDGTPEIQQKTPWWQVPAWFLDEFAPWSALALAAIFMTKNWLRSPMAPAILWVLLGVTFFCCSAGKRADYLAPVYPLAAVIAACWLMNLIAPLAMGAHRVALIVTIFAAGMAFTQLEFSKWAQYPYADNMKIFASRCKPIIGEDQVIVLLKGYQPFLPLIGRASLNPNGEQLKEARWAVCPIGLLKKSTPTEISGDVGDVHQKGSQKVALYRIPNDEAIQKLLRTRLTQVRQHNGVESTEFTQ